MRPIRNNVILKATPEEEVLKSGIILTGSKNKDKLKCEVTAVGEGSKERPMSLKPGMSCYIPKNAGTRIKLPEGEVIIIDDSMVLVYEDK